MVSLLAPMRAKGPLGTDNLTAPFVVHCINMSFSKRDESVHQKGNINNKTRDNR